MNQMKNTPPTLADSVLADLSETFGTTLEQATAKQLYLSTAHAMTRRLSSLHRKTEQTATKRVYYLSMEFLVGKSLERNLTALGLKEEYEALLHKLDKDPDSIYALEPDPGLGNGGLGRLASCFLESASTLSVPFTGFSIKYDFGIFRQKIVDGWQVEFPDEWLEMGHVLLRPRREDAVKVLFDGRIEGRFDESGYHADHVDAHEVIAVPHDLFVPGYDGNYCNVLTLWQATSPASFDMSAFSRGDYIKALEEETMAEVISKVLYPADDHIEGKKLRLRQQYLLVSASVQSIIIAHMRRYGDIRSLPDHVAIHLNDTHPALTVPELMRILLDDYRLSWEDAWDLMHRTITYTNHTIMSEAMERWDLHLYRSLLPRIAQITEEIDKRTRHEFEQFYPSDRAKIDYMAVVSRNEVRMANLSLAAAHKVNGVSELHSEILRTRTFHDYATIYKDRFTSVTNGIAYRRWLLQANPALATLLDQTIGTAYHTDASKLEDFLSYRYDTAVLDRLNAIKHENKVALASLIAARNDIHIDPHALMDVQVKRLHEYKRQLLAALGILARYLQIKDDPGADHPHTTHVFAAKASGGYLMAKQILRLLVSISRLVETDPDARKFLHVVFLENYNVSLAQIIIPSAQISTQISLAGKEASGTGNMKMMMNGAITLGTADGANVEIFERVGEENAICFGLKTTEVEQILRNGYRPGDYIARSPMLRRVIDLLRKGFLGLRFDEILSSLLSPAFGMADRYLICADFDAYLDAKAKADTLFADRSRFAKAALVNIAKSGVFSADRAVREYQTKLWNIP